ncbi:uncharacterized protein LOC116011416 [Ipomoea triloba]|uniref:uncharacterized protein LOC116011416 n=1 Tax=Ipomoea triloba TaxID=35885 RepID=UPI00125E04CF|nr:uncharacterized protein LOC116011416 [Ipomoea triloba]
MVVGRLRRQRYCYEIREGERKDQEGERMASSTSRSATAASPSSRRGPESFHGRRCLAEQARSFAAWPHEQFTETGGDDDGARKVSAAVENPSGGGNGSWVAWLAGGKGCTIFFDLRLTVMDDDRWPEVMAVVIVS